MPDHDLSTFGKEVRSEAVARDVDAATDTMVTDARVNHPHMEMSPPRLGQIRLPMKLSPIHASSPS